MWDPSRLRWPPYTSAPTHKVGGGNGDVMGIRLLVAAILSLLAGRVFRVNWLPSA
jgi:hypothetical protein